MKNPCFANTNTHKQFFSHECYSEIMEHTIKLFRINNKYIFLLIIIFPLIGTIVNSQNTPQLVYHKDSTFTGIKKIKVDAKFCKVEINNSSDNTIHLSGDLNSDKNDPAYTMLISATNGILTLNVQYPSSGWSSHSGSVLLNIPNGLELDIEAFSGQIYIQGTQLLKATIKTKSGNIEVKESSGDIITETITAKINISKHNGLVKTKSKTGSQYFSTITGKVSALTSEGELVLADITGPVRTEATSGNTDIDRIQGEIISKAAAGSIKIADSNGNITVTTFSGFIKLFNITGIVNLQSTTGEQVGTRVELTASSTFNTTEGKIKMQIDNPIESLTFNLESTNSFLQAAQKSKKKKLKVGKGSIVITGISTTGGQVYSQK
ncbi:MAG: hypothetical protein JW717_12015 [Marinilabiliaceae bacterium]|nr:hypothetical protein [Marinilabiliaceae bacterium]